MNGIAPKVRSKGFTCAEEQFTLHDNVSRTSAPLCFDATVLHTLLGRSVGVAVFLRKAFGFEQGFLLFHLLHVVHELHLQRRYQLGLLESPANGPQYNRTEHAEEEKNAKEYDQDGLKAPLSRR